MTNPKHAIRCGSCDSELDEPPSTPAEARRPCPDCGSTKRTIHVALESAIHVRQKLGHKLERPGSRKPVREGVCGDDLFRKTRKWMKLEREIDRENDRYREVITNPETGEVIRHCEEPLSQHRGRGSARPSS